MSAKDASDLANRRGQTEKDWKTLSCRVNELYHDLQADEFDEIHRARHRAERLFWQTEVAPRLSRAEAAFGVDLCTGTGLVPCALLETMESSPRILCIDLSHEAMERAKTTLGVRAGQVTFHSGDATAIPLPDGAADWVSINAGLHHIPDPRRVLNEVDRVLKGGGFFCLGYEPNAAFFASRFLVHLERVIWHAFWYLSPARNVKRIRRRLGRHVGGGDPHEHLDVINAKLLREGLVDTPLTPAQLRKLVDIHTHSDEEDKKKAGFRTADLINRHFPTYTVEKILFSDYGGQMLRKHLWLRGLFDVAMRAMFPLKGRLFSWIIRKPRANNSPSDTL